MVMGFDHARAAAPQRTSGCRAELRLIRPTTRRWTPLRARVTRSVRRRRRRTGRRQLAGATRATGPTRAEARRRRTVRGSHPRAVGPAVLPRSAAGAPGSSGSEHHAVVTAVVAVMANTHDH